MMKTIDLRSDTVTQPGKEMRTEMAQAETGDDVCGEDPTVNRLEAVAADMLGMEAALFAPSGTQCNLLGIMAHCERGDEYIVGQTAHTYKFEGGGAAVLGSIQPQPLDFEPDGTLDLNKVAQAVKPPDFHFARTRLLCLENTQGGKALPMAYLKHATVFARENNLRLHLDGARIFNAAVKHNTQASEISRHFDSVSVCLSKGLGAPVGSVLCAGKELIKTARRWRKVLGGGMRQAGILAAAGLFALERNIPRLAEDHANAAALATGLAGIDELAVEYGPQQTNMVFIEAGPAGEKALPEFLAERGIIIRRGTRIRLVTHLDISSTEIPRVVAAVKEFFRKNPG
jgi:threonine aldolase